MIFWKISILIKFYKCFSNGINYDYREICRQTFWKGAWQEGVSDQGPHYLKLNASSLIHNECRNWNSELVKYLSVDGGQLSTIGCESTLVRVESFAFSKRYKQKGIDKRKKLLAP